MNVKEMRQMARDELLAAREQLEREAWHTRFQFHTGAESSAAKLRVVRRNVARINTIIRERDLDARRTQQGK